MTELDRVSPNDPNRYIRLARVRVGANDPAGAGYVEKANAAAKAAGGKPTEGNYRLLLKAYETANKDKYYETLAALITDYPKPEYWAQYINLAQREPGFQAAGSVGHQLENTRCGPFQDCSA